MKKIMIAIMFVLSLAGCKKDEIDVFGDTRYIYFNTISGLHEVRYSFLYSEGKDEVDVELPLSYSGRRYDSAVAYAVSIDKTFSTAPENSYELPETPVFKAGSYNDVLVLKVKNSSELKESEYKLRINLVTNNGFMAAVRDSLTMDVYWTDMTTQPGWWDQEVIDSYLGPYSNRKMELFVEHGYSGDYGALSYGEKHVYAIKFKNWLADRKAAGDTQYDENNVEITVPAVG